MDKAVLVLSGNSREWDMRSSASRAMHVPLCREKWQLSVLWIAMWPLSSCQNRTSSPPGPQIAAAGDFLLNSPWQSPDSACGSLKGI